MLLCKYHDVTLAANDADAYTCLRPYRMLILAAILLKISLINLKIMNIQKIEKNKHFDQNNPYNL